MAVHDGRFAGEDDQVVRGAQVGAYGLRQPPLVVFVVQGDKVNGDQVRIEGGEAGA